MVLSEDVLAKVYDLLSVHPSLRDSEIRPRWRERFGEDLDVTLQGFKTIQQWMKAIPSVNLTTNGGALCLHRTKKTPRLKRKCITPLPPKLSREEKAARLQLLPWSINKIAYEWTTPPLPCCVSCETIPLAHCFVLMCKHLMCRNCYVRRSTHIAVCQAPGCRHPLNIAARVPDEPLTHPLYNHLFALITKCAQPNCKRIDTLDNLATHITACIIREGKQGAIPIEPDPNISKAEMKRRGKIWELTFHQLLDTIIVEVKSREALASTGAEEAPSEKQTLYIRDTVPIEVSWSLTDLVPEADILAMDSQFGPQFPRRQPFQEAASTECLLPVVRGQKIDIIGHSGNSLFGWCLGQVNDPEEDTCKHGWFPTRCIVPSPQSINTTIQYLECIRWRDETDDTP